MPGLRGLLNKKGIKNLEAGGICILFFIFTHTIQQS